MDSAGVEKSGSTALKWVAVLLALNVGMFLAGMALQYLQPVGKAPQVFNAEKIRVLELPAEPKHETVIAPPPEPAEVEAVVAAVVAPTEEPTLSEPKKVSAQRCLSWASLDAEGLQRIEAHLKQKGLAAGAYTYKLDQKLGWWVFIPPLSDKSEVEAMILAVRRQGVTDLAPVRAGSMRNAISLGTFSSFEQARNHAASLSKKRIKNVKFSPRLVSGPLHLVIAESVGEGDLPSPDSGWPKGLQPTPCR